jgi:hypothetical protein
METMVENAPCVQTHLTRLCVSPFNLARLLELGSRFCLSGSYHVIPSPSVLISQTSSSQSQMVNGSLYWAIVQLPTRLAVDFICGSMFFASQLPSCSHWLCRREASGYLEGEVDFGCSTARRWVLVLDESSVFMGSEHGQAIVFVCCAHIHCWHAY